MDEWLEANKERYGDRLLDGKPYVVEFYDERYDGDNEDSIVDIWVPIQEIEYLDSPPPDTYLSKGPIEKEIS